MTRRREMMLEDLFDCEHEPEIPIVDDGGSILYWRCRCGEKRAVPESDDECGSASTEKE